MSTTNKGAGTGFALFALAVLIAVIGFVNGAEGPTCGRDAMSPGDTCYIDGERNTYADRQAASRNAPLVNGLIALVLVGCAIGSWCRSGGDSTPASGRPPAAAGGGTGSSTAALPLARTPAEAHLAMGLSPCACGAAGVPRKTALYDVPGGYLQRYFGSCSSCGKPREFTFRMSRTPVESRSGEFRFGDGTPSQLIDPGLWLAVADHYARLSPGDASGLDGAARRTARLNLARAAAAVDEVIAFIPSGSTTVPLSAFSTTGRQIREREPGRFSRARLEAVRDTYRQIVAEMTESPSDRTRSAGV